MGIWESSSDEEEETALTKKEWWQLTEEDLKTPEQVNHLTRSGRHYRPESWNQPQVPQAPRLPQETTQMQDPHQATGSPTAFQPKKNPSRPQARGTASLFQPRYLSPDLEEDGFQLLKQLQKTKANITVWQLITTSIAHRKMLLDALEAIDMPSNSTPDELVNLLIHGKSNLITTITFTDDDLPSEGTQHNKALYLTIVCKQLQVPMTLVDNGSTVNVCPLRTAKHMNIDCSELKPTGLTLKGFDNSKSKVVGTFSINIRTGNVEKKTKFHVIDIPASFNLLLGRPWLHSLKAVSSTLHQKAKMPVEEKVLEVRADTLIATIEKFPVLGIEPTEDSDLEIWGHEGINVIKDEVPFDFTPYSQQESTLYSEKPITSLEPLWVAQSSASLRSWR